MPEVMTTRIDGFLKVPDIPGPSTRDGHEEEIEVYGVGYEMQRLPTIYPQPFDIPMDKVLTEAG